jgi:large conductance mechanosensitive channel
LSLIKEFREFAIKGSFVDLAVGVILGAATGKVVSVLVDKIIMPPIGLLLGRVRFTELRVVLQDAELGPAGEELTKEVAIGYGAAIQAFIELLIVGFVVFLLVRVINRFRRQAPPPGPSAQEKLLAEIRDILKQRGTGNRDVGES